MFDGAFNNQTGSNQNFFAEDMNVDVDVTMNNNNAQNMSSMMGMGQTFQGGVSQPIIEPMQERIVNRTILHEVPHICPMRTRIINNHVFRHTFSPAYSCCEENTCTNVQCGSCCGFNNR